MSEIFQVTARKWRPMRFDDVAGQEHVTRTLKNAIAAGRLAHAYLFTGQRGCGKTTVARILAKAINCPNAATNGYEPCNHCENCLAVTDGRSMDVAEIDGASNNGVDDVRMLRDNVKYPPLQGKYKVIIIDEVHMLSTSAFNALLKTLEEPPAHLVFVFATTDAQKVLPTILSRTQRYDFRRIQVEVIVALLRKIADADGITIEDDALLMIARKADGSARDAESIFDQAVAYSGMNVETARLREALNLIDLDFYFEVSEAISAREAKRAFDLSGEIISRGYDIEEFITGLLEHFRNILTVSITNSTKLIEVSKVHQERYANHAKQFVEGDLLRLIRLGQNALERLRITREPRIVLEVVLVEMMLLERALELSQLIEEVRALSGTGTGVRVSGSVVVAPQTPSPEKKSNGVAPAPGSANISASFPKSQTKNPQSRTPEPEPRTPSEDPKDTLDSQTVANRWPEFGDFLRTKSRPLYSILPDLEFCGIRHSTIYLAVGDVSKGMLNTMKDEMVLALREFFGAQLTFEAGPKQEMHAKAGSPIVINPEVVMQAASGAVKSKTEERSPIELELISIGATEV